MKIGIISDHKGYELKTKIIKSLTKEYQFIDYGTNSNVSVDYPIYASKLGKAINNKEISLGISICGTGIGISIALNKIENIYCGKVSTVEEAYLTKLHNHANCIALSGKTSLYKAKKIIKKFIETIPSNEDRHLRRVLLIKKLEDNNEC